MTFRPLLSLAAPLALSFALSACGTMEKLPKISMPDLPKVKVPFVGNDSTAPADDPVVPYSVKQTLAHGHTLNLAVYAGQRSPSKVFVGSVMVDEKGLVNLGKYGEAKVGGLTAIQAEKYLEAAFRRKRGESIITVQFISIEDTPTLSIRGAVKHPAVIQYFDGASPSNVLPYVGGHGAGTSGRAVYITRNGVRAFHSDYANPDLSLEAGDVVTFSDAL